MLGAHRGRSACLRRHDRPRHARERRGRAPTSRRELQRSLLTARAAGLGPPLARRGRSRCDGAAPGRIPPGSGGRHAGALPLHRRPDSTTAGRRSCPTAPTGPPARSGRSPTSSRPSSAKASSGSEATTVRRGRGARAGAASSRTTHSRRKASRSSTAHRSRRRSGSRSPTGDRARRRRRRRPRRSGSPSPDAGARAARPGSERSRAIPTRRGVQQRLSALLAAEDVWGDRRSRRFRHGSSRRCTAWRSARSPPSTTILDERLRGTSDSPVFLDAGAADGDGLYPSGAFHAVDVVVALESLAIALCHVVNLLEKRLHRLLDSRFSQLPDQLTTRPGVQAGVVALHKTVVGLTPRRDARRPGLDARARHLETGRRTCSRSPSSSPSGSTGCSTRSRQPSPVSSSRSARRRTSPSPSRRQGAPSSSRPGRSRVAARRRGSHPLGRCAPRARRSSPPARFAP